MLTRQSALYDDDPKSKARRNPPPPTPGEKRLRELSDQYSIVWARILEKQKQAIHELRRRHEKEHAKQYPDAGRDGRSGAPAGVPQETASHWERETKALRAQHDEERKEHLRRRDAELAKVK
jgi:hypothetical protein